MKYRGYIKYHIFPAGDNSHAVPLPFHGCRFIIKNMEKKPVTKKNPCPDCSFCQCCSETRCRLCKSVDCPSSKKLKKKKEHIPLFRKF